MQPSESTNPKAVGKRWSSRRKFLLLLLVASLLFWSIRNTQKARRQQELNAQTAYRPPESAAQARLPESDRSVEHSQSTTEQVTNPVSEGSHPLDPVLKLAEELRLQIKSSLIDYTATITKRERIRGKLLAEETMEAKIRQARTDSQAKVPFSVYLKFVPPGSSAGREVIWVDGQNDGDLLSYQFRIPVKIAPTGTIAMMGNKYPITEIGLLRLVDKLIEKGQRDRELGDCLVEIFENQAVDGRQCKLIQVTHPDRDARFDFHIAQIFIDNQLQLPIRYAAYLWPDETGASPPLEEEYTYKNLKINVGLTDKDFDSKNPDYRFPQ